MRALTTLIAPTIAVVMYLLQKGDEPDARDVLIELTDISEQEPALFKPNFQEHARMLIQARAVYSPALRPGWAAAPHVVQNVFAELAARGHADALLART